jgi:hypothetical protein
MQHSSLNTFNIMAECHYAVCRYAECRYAECRKYILYVQCRYAQRCGAVITLFMAIFQQRRLKDF